MKKKCPDGKYYCYTDKKCKDIPKGFKVVGPAGMLRKENGHSIDDDSEIKNGNGGSVSEDLRKWFGSGPEGGKGGGGWDRYNTKGERIGKCARGEGEGKPKCLSNEKAAKMSKAERASAVRRKRREDPVADRPGKGGKPIMTSNKIKESSSPLVRHILEKIECEKEWILVEKNVPTNPSLWSKFKAQAKAKFDVYPSAYANGWAAKKYKAAGGSWKKATSESVQHELEEKKGCAHNHEGEECPIHGENKCPSVNKIEEAVRVPAKTGNLYLVSFTWKGKYMMMKIFFPEVSRPTRNQVQDALEKVYPGCKVSRFDMTHYQPGEPMLAMGEEVEQVDEDWQKVNKSDKTDGMGDAAIKAYRRENPNSKLKGAVTGNPKKGSKDAERRKNYCDRSKGQQDMHNIDCTKTPDKPICKARRRWKCS